MLKKITPAAHEGSSGGTSERAHQHVRAARLVDHRPAKAIEIAAESLAPRRERAGSEIGAAGDDDARRLASGVRIDDLDLVHA